MAPPAKKAKTGEEEKAEAKTEEMEVSKEEEAPKEPEQDAPTDKGARIKQPVAFLTEDTTMNVMPGTSGNVLMQLTEGGLQYLLAGARASVGVKSGRYMFEAHIVEATTLVEDTAARNRTPLPRNQLRVGFSTAGSSLFLGDTEENVFFDTEGAFVHGKKKQAGPQGVKFASGDVVAVVLNLDSKSPNAETLSLFKNGQRVSAPQALPDALKGKPLYPHVTYKNVTVHYNFGPTPLVALPFQCRMLQDATAKDVQVTTPPAQPKGAKPMVVFPVSIPDEGTFDWLDMWLESNKQFHELSDRAVKRWAEKSDLACVTKPKPESEKNSNDKPEMGFAIPQMDDGSILRVLSAVAPLQKRDCVVMEVKSNLIQEERKELLSKWAGYKRSATVLMGEPKADMKKRAQELALKAKQEVSDAEFRARKAEEKKKKMLEKRQKKLEKERKKALELAKKKQEALKKKLEAERKKKEAAEKGEPVEEEEEEEKKPEEKKEESEEEKEEEEAEEEEQPPKAELTPDEKKLTFRKTAFPDLTPYVLNTSFTKFSVPEKEDGFDEIRYEWSNAEKCKDYLKTWVRDRKLTTRIEDLQPSEWFGAKLKDWQKTLSAWHAKQNQYKALLTKKEAEKKVKEAKKKAAADKAAAEAEKKKKEAEEKKEGEEKGDEKKEETAMEVEEEKEEEEAPPVNLAKLDVFGVEDVLDIGGGQPLFSSFASEDWTMMALRFEIHLLCHAFRRDANDPDRQGIHLEHLAFYYHKYYKKTLNVKSFGVEGVKELMEYIRDTVVICGKGNIVEAQIPDDMESQGVFVMLTEEARRDRNRRIDLGDESAKLKIAAAAVPPAVAAATVRAGNIPVQPPRPAPPRPAGAPAAAWRPAAGFGAGVRPATPARPYAAGAWRGISK